MKQPFKSGMALFVERTNLAVEYRSVPEILKRLGNL
jgi:hypothetical protein